MSFLAEKNLVREFYEVLETSNIEDTKKVFLKYCSKDIIWRGFHPFNEINGGNSVCELFWNPLKSSCLNLQEEWIFFLRETILFRVTKVFGGRQWAT